MRGKQSNTDDLCKVTRRNCTESEINFEKLNVNVRMSSSIKSKTKIA